MGNLPENLIHLITHSTTSLTTSPLVGYLTPTDTATEPPKRSSTAGRCSPSCMYIPLIIVIIIVVLLLFSGGAEEE